ncbi:hypothetical protein E3P77_04104 [Wallemia ichthyophaga]|nr:hypothetical protein E3P77_04104 [Wallemia ichthyophaga]
MYLPHDNAANLHTHAKRDTNNAATTGAVIAIVAAALAFSFLMAKAYTRKRELKMAGSGSGAIVNPQSAPANPFLDHFPRLSRNEVTHMTHRQPEEGDEQLPPYEPPAKPVATAENSFNMDVADGTASAGANIPPSYETQPVQAAQTAHTSDNTRQFSPPDHPPPPPAYWKEPFDAAVKEYRRGDYEKSLELLDRVALHSHLTVYDTKCATLLKLNRTDQALQVARKMTQIDEKSPKGYRRCANILKSRSLNKQALAMANLALKQCEYISKVTRKQDPLFLEMQDLRDELQVVEQLRLSSFRDPLTVLPLEMVLDIVELAAESTNDYSLVTRLSHVNSLWRQTVLSIPQLWRRCAIKFDGSGRALKKLNTFYKRANNTPLRHIKMHLLNVEEVLSFCTNPLPSIDINANINLSTLEMVYSHKFKINPFFEPISGISGDKMFQKVDKLVCADGGSLAHHDLRDIDEDFVLNRVKNTLELDGFNYHAQSGTPGNYTLKRFKLSKSRAPPINHLMNAFPNLESFEWDQGYECHEESDSHLININMPILETLLIADVRDGLRSITPPRPIPKYNLPNLKRCILKGVPLYMLECVQDSPKLIHLSIQNQLDTDFSLMANAPDPSVYIDRFIGAFSNLNDLQVLDLTGTGYGVIILHTITQKKLCPRLRAVNVSRTAGSFGRLLIELIKQRNSTPDLTSIDELIANRCPELEHEAVAWARRHVSSVQCVYETKEESRKQPRQRYRYERV